MAQNIVADKNEIALRRLIHAGNLEGMVEFLKEAGPDEIFTFQDWEPYTAIQRPAQVSTLQLLLNDPRFSFDDLFVARALYFSTRQIHGAILKHSRMDKLVFGYRNSFIEYFDRRFSRKDIGFEQRYIHAMKSVERCKSMLLNKMLAFALYPALVRYSREFKKRYYAPGTGVGYMKVKAHFEQIK